MDGGCQELPNELKNTKNGLGSWKLWSNWWRCWADSGGCGHPRVRGAGARGRLGKQPGGAGARWFEVRAPGGRRFGRKI